MTTLTRETGDGGDKQLASSRVIANLFAGRAETLLDNGYSPIPVEPGEKRPASRCRAWPKYGSRPPSSEKMAGWVRDLPDHSIGIVCENAIAVDIDILDPALALEIQNLAEKILGETPLLRFGCYPKRLLVYRADGAVASSKQTTSGGLLEILAKGRQFVAYGIHPTTGGPYYWLYDDPQFVHIDGLPLIGQRSINRFLAKAEKLVGGGKGDADRSVQEARQHVDGAHGQDPNGGKRWDGRDAFLRDITLAEYRGMLNTEHPVTPKQLAEKTWRRFSAEADISRPKGNGRGCWSSKDARTKAKYLLRRVREGKLDLYRAEHKKNFGSRKGGFWTKAYKDKFDRIVSADRNLPPSAVTVNAALLSDLNRDGQDLAWPSVERLAKETGLAQSTVSKALRQLHAAEYWVTIRKGNQGCSSVRCPHPRWKERVMISD